MDQSRATKLRFLPAIVGGLAVSQLLTLYTVPVVYLWLDRVRLKFRRKKAEPKLVTAAQS